MINKYTRNVLETYKIQIPKSMLEKSNQNYT